MRKQLLALFSIPVFVTPYLPDDFADDLAEAAEQFRSFHGIHSAVVGSVRTNALESARATVPTERRDSTPPPVSTNRVSEAGAPAVQDGAAAVSDPWAGLLDDLPEKKPWTPPPGYEPPF